MADISLNADETPFVVAKAAFGQTAAVFALLPELLAATALPPFFVVAYAPQNPFRILGAAAFLPQVDHAERPGFICHCRVLPAYRQQGIGKALTQFLAAEVAAWDVGYLHAPLTYDDDSPEAAFLQQMGFCVSSSMHFFVGDTLATLPMLQRLVKALYDRSRVPEGFTIKPFSEANPDDAADLLCRQFGGSVVDAHRQIEQALNEPYGETLSLSLTDGERLAGFLIAGYKKNTPEVNFWVTDPTFRQGWPAALLLEGFVSRISDLGFSQGRYSCNDKTRATLNVARKTGAQLEAVRRSYVLALATEE